jgi:CheY-like chemotaxis protein
VLDQATQLIEEKYPQIGRNKSLGQQWHDWLRFHFVRQEAERLLKGKIEAAAEAPRPSNAFSGAASSGRLICAPGPMTLVFFRGPAPQQRTPHAIFLYSPNQTGGGPLGTALAALALLALDTPRVPSGFQAPLAFDAGSNPVSVAVGDFNRDGIADLVVANHASNNVSVLLGKGDGTFRAAVNYVAGAGPNAVTVADLNGDGIPDLAAFGEQTCAVLPAEALRFAQRASRSFASRICPLKALKLPLTPEGSSPGLAFAARGRPRCCCGEVESPVMSRRCLLLADAHPDMLEAVRGLLAARFTTTVMVADETSLLEAVGRIGPDLVVVDHSLSVSGDVNVVRTLLSRYPGLRVIVLSVHDEQAAACQVLGAGAAGFVLKRTAAIDLTTAVDAVLRGETYLSAALGSRRGLRGRVG